LSSVQKWHRIPNGIAFSLIVQFYKKRMNTCAQMQEDLLNNFFPAIALISFAENSMVISKETFPEKDSAE
jgi:hypothetical protein